MKVAHYRPRTHDGWQLDIRHYRNDERFDPTLMPVVLVPGYAMNTFILQFHPTARSLVDYLTDAGFEVFTTNLRGQGKSKRLGRRRPIGFRELALIDTQLSLNFCRDQATGTRQGLAAVGCSLGASVLYANLAHHAEESPVEALVSMGGPLRWDQVHPLIKVAFSSPRLAGSLPILGTRALARRALPIVKQVPPLLSIYMNSNQIDLSQVNELVKTVEDPIPYLNRQIAHWLRDRDLKVAGVNVTRAMQDIDHLPLLCIIANKDGIVPPEAGLSISEHLGGDDIEVLVAGDDIDWYAHADLFISEEAEETVFEPLAEWLTLRSQA